MGINKTDNRLALENRISSVSGLTAQNNTLCVGADLVNADKIGLYTYDELKQIVDSVDFSVILLLHYFGLRISEVLNINNTDVLEGCLIRVRTLKGGTNRLISGAIYPNYWLKVKQFGLSDHTLRGRFYYYRLFKRLGLHSQFVGNSKQSVTHSFRHHFVLRLLKDGVEYEEIKTIIGHNNVKNTKIYGKKEL